MKILLQLVSGMDRQTDGHTHTLSLSLSDPLLVPVGLSSTEW